MSDLYRLNRIKLYSLIIFPLFVLFLVGTILISFIFPLGLTLLIGSGIATLVFSILNIINVIELSDSSNRTIMIVFAILALVGLAIVSSIVCLVISIRMILILKAKIAQDRKEVSININDDSKDKKNNFVKTNELNNKENKDMINK